MTWPQVSTRPNDLNPPSASVTTPRMTPFAVIRSLPRAACCVKERLKGYVGFCGLNWSSRPIAASG